MKSEEKNKKNNRWKEAIKKLKQKGRKGLTLVELAIVLLVLGVIIGIVYAGLNTGIVDDADRAMFPVQAKKTALEWQQYERRVGKIAQGDTLAVLAQNDPQNGWRAIDEKLTKDMWGNPYFVCLSPAGYREVCTYGADGQPGGEGENQDFFVTDEASWPRWLKGAN